MTTEHLLELPVWVCRTCGIDWDTGAWRFHTCHSQDLHAHVRDEHGGSVGWWDHRPLRLSGETLAAAALSNRIVPDPGTPLWMTRCRDDGAVFVADTAFGARLELWEHCRRHNAGTRPDPRCLRLTDRESRILRRDGPRAVWPGAKRDRPPGLVVPERPSAQDLIEFLTALAPCPVWEQLPAWERTRHSRSRYFRRRRGCRARNRDFIHMNERARAWEYALTLIHELGHALDHHGRHPLQAFLTGRHGRYRQELAATSMTHLVVCRLGLDQRLATARRYLRRERAYLHEYVPGTDSPVWDDLPLEIDPFAELLA